MTCILRGFELAGAPPSSEVTAKNTGVVLVECDRDVQESGG